MNLLPLAMLAAALLGPRAMADKFYVGAANDPKQAEGSSAEYISGVLISESKTEYHIRIVGGEITLPKNRVLRVEKDGFTVDAVVRSEKDRTEKLAAEETDRRRTQADAADAAARRRMQRQASEATVRPSDVAGAQPAVQPGYDPVRDVSATGLSEAALMMELKAAYEATGDDRYMKQLRQLRRMH
jgi:hypothetical protein